MIQYREDLKRWEEELISRRGKVKGFKYEIFGAPSFTTRKKFRSRSAHYTGFTPLPPVHDRNGYYLK